MLTPHEGWLGAAAATAPHGEQQMERTLARLEVRPAVHAYVVGMLASIAAALAVVLKEIATQSGRILDADGHGWTFATLFGPDFGSGLNAQGWTVVTTPGQLTPEGMARYAELLRTHAIVDSLFAVVYLAVLIMLVRTLTPAHPRWRLVGQIAVGVLGAADLAENVCGALAISGDLSPQKVTVLTTTKWFALVLIVVVVALRLATRRRDDLLGADGWIASGGSRFRRAVKAVVHQRFSFAPVVVIFVLSVPSGAAILEQLPDAQRAWTTDDGTGVRHAVAAIVATLLLSGFLLVVGRQRTTYARKHPNDHAVGCHPAGSGPAREGGRHLWVWTVVPGITLASLVVVVGWGGQQDAVLGIRVALFVVPPLVLVGASLLCRAAWEKSRRGERAWLGRDRPYRPPTFSEAETFAVGVAGTVAGVLALVVGGLSLIRAFVPLLVLPVDAYTETGNTAWVRGWVILMMVVGAFAVVVPWLVAIGFARAYGGPHRGRIREGGSRLGTNLHELASWAGEVPLLAWSWNRRPVVLLAGAASVFVGLGVFPSLAGWLGLAATATLALGSLAGIVSGIGLVLQDHPTAEVFRLVGFRRTPLITLLVLTIVFVGVAGGVTGTKPNPHAVATGPATSPVDLRPTLDQAFARWYDAAARCQVGLGPYEVRPMLMVAAEGGGIRAAYWTVKGLEAIADQTCAGSSTLFSGGASGGSVGLTVARFSGSGDEPGGAAAVAAVEQMARSETLSRAADGTFVRDVVYGASGVPVPRFGETDQFAWRDRARLIEDGWSTSGAWGQASYLADQDASATTGALVLNSTDVRNSCRVWVSQLRLPAPAAPQRASFDPERSCDTSPGVASRTIDLFTAYGPYVAGATTPTCLGQISAVTAALLTARFPYVTPSGVVGPCPNRTIVAGTRMEPYWPRTQLVDGGYLENTGLSTVTDLSDQWLALVREHNRAALADQATTKPVLVVPIVVFLANGERSVSQPQLGAAPTSELTVPLKTLLAGGSALSNNDALLARARDAVDIRGFCQASADANPCPTLAAAFPSRVVVVDRVTQPEVGAPLGWTLSGESITALDHAMAAQVDSACQANEPRAADVEPFVATASARELSCRPGYATLGDLIRYLRGGRDAR